jgi:hypothetical protein
VDLPVLTHGWRDLTLDPDLFLPHFHDRRPSNLRVLPPLFLNEILLLFCQLFELGLLDLLIREGQVIVTQISSLSLQMVELGPLGFEENYLTFAVLVEIFLVFVSPSDVV